jgi:putative hemolysin
LKPIHAIQDASLLLSPSEESIKEELSLGMTYCHTRLRSAYNLVWISSFIETSPSLHLTITKAVHNLACIGDDTHRGHGVSGLSLFLRDGTLDRKMILPPDGQDQNAGLGIFLPKAFTARIAPFAQPAIQHIVRWQELIDLYACVNQPEDEDQIWERILSSLNVAYEVSPEELANIPARGPLVVVANHPYGGIEGVILAALLRSVRRDVKVLANLMLCSFPGLRKSLIPVDPFAAHGSTTSNVRGLKAAIQWVRKGGALAVFPAGEVAHVDWNQWAITDPAWHEVVAAIIRRTSAAAVPVYFAGSNGPMFQLLGMVHPLLRTVMLPSELLNKRNRVFKVRVGHPLSHPQLKSFPDDAEMTTYLRWRTYHLGYRKDKGKTLGKGAWRTKTAQGAAPTVLGPPECAAMEREIQNLPPDQILIAGGDESVILAKAQQIPRVLREIGRLREVAFRSVGEGTGKEIDLDRFDSYYDHLFVWRKSQRQVLGAYRLGLTDFILENYGKKGLYTSTLFDFHDGFFRRIGPALELGRSFVRLECQGAMNALPLLWRGIGRFILCHPQCKILFGPVSISNHYHPVSQNMMVTYLQQNHLTQELSCLLKPRAPFRPSRVHPQNPAPPCFKVKDVQELSELISEIETDHKQVPILLKHYLKLGGKIVGFNVDGHFSHVLDGLIVVDLTKTERRILERFVAPEGARRFLAYHQT